MSSLRFFALLAVVLLGSGLPAFSFETNGDLDPGFNPPHFTNGQVQASVVQPDGKLVIAGGFAKVNGVARRNIARLNGDGTLDNSFDPLSSTDGTIAQLFLQADGKFIIVGGATDAGGGGQFFTVNGTARNNIARLNADGSLDTSFDPGALLTADGDVSGGLPNNPGYANAVAIQSNGKIVILGPFIGVANGATTFATRSGIARFNVDGSFDSTFDPGTAFSDPVNTLGASSSPFPIGRQSSDKIIIAGSFTIYNGSAVPGFVRLNADGSYDGTFSVGTGPDSVDNLDGIYVQSDDQIITFGSMASFNGAACSGVVRLGIDGPRDGTFNTGAFQNYRSHPTIEACTQQPDGKYLLGGIFYSVDSVAAGSVIRLNNNGTRDATFDATGTKTAGQVFCFAKRLLDNEYFVGGYFSSYGPETRNNIALVKTDGTNDTAFLLTTGVSDFSPQVFALSVQADGKILVGGLFSSVDGQSRYNLARLNADGSLDSTFANSAGVSRSIRAFGLQASGKVLIAGSFYAVDGAARPSVARLNPDGSLDTSFDAGTGADINSVNAIAVDSSDNCYIGGGGLITFNGVPRNNLVKLGPNGALDLSFNTGAGPNSTVNAIAPPTGSAGLVIGGAFSTYNGTSVGRIARLDLATGALDTAFNTAAGTGFNSTVRGLYLRADGKYDATGGFIRFNSTSSNRSRLARLNADGSLDTTFIPSPGIIGTPRTLLEQNSKIITGGAYTNPVPQLARYGTTGTRDTSLNVGSGLSTSNLEALAPEIDGIALQTDGKLLIGGIFSSYQGTPRFSLARLGNTHLTITSIVPYLGHLKISGLGDPSTTYSFQASPDLSPGSFSEIGMVTTDGTGNWFYEDFAAPAMFVKRFYRAAFY